VGRESSTPASNRQVSGRRALLPRCICLHAMLKMQFSSKEERAGISARSIENLGAKKPSVGRVTHVAAHENLLQTSLKRSPNAAFRDVLRPQHTPVSPLKKRFATVVQEQQRI
jgi:hypothetical protein